MSSFRPYVPSRSSILGLVSVSTPRTGFPRMRPLLMGVLAVFFGSLLAVPALAQNRASAADSLVLTADDVRFSTDECTVFRRYEANPSDNASPQDSVASAKALQGLLEQIGRGGPYDLTPFPLSPADSGVAFTRPVSALAALPGAKRAARRGADRISVRTHADGSHSLRFHTVQEEGMYSYGFASFSIYGSDVQIYDQANRTPLPMRVGTTWSREEDDGDVRQMEVTGAGEVIAPTVTAPHLVLTVAEEGADAAPSSLERVRFLDASGAVSAMLYGPRGARRLTYWKRTHMRTPEAPEGYTTHCAYLGGELPVAFPVPTNWTVMNLHGKSPSTSSVSLTRNPAAIDSFRGGGTEISTGARMWLGTPKNVMVSIVAFGMDDEPDEYLQGLRLGSLDDTEVIQSVSRREVRGRSAYEKQWRGIGARGRPLVATYVAFRAADLLFQVTVHRPPEMPGTADEVVQVVLDHLTVGEETVSSEG